MNKQQLASKIWAAANEMRSKIEASEYKDYILGFIFYKFLSEQEESYLKKIGATDEDIREIREESEEAVSIQKNLGYFIEYKNLFSTWLNMGSDFTVENVSDALSAFNRLINPSHAKVFNKIFLTLETGLSKLGENSNAQTKAVRELIHLIKIIPMDNRQGYDVLGFIYEYLISNFAANAGKKAGEFYTPHEVSLLMSEIIANYLQDRDEIKIYDPTSGSGSLLINIGQSVAKHINDKNKIKYYAQELKENTYNLTRMNLIMRGILPDNIVTRCGDTLEDDWPYFEEADGKIVENTYEPLTNLDAVVSNPPYSQKWNPVDKQHDPRFNGYGVAPKTKADYAFLLHDLYHLRPGGIMTIVLPHGVLFRGGDEGKIRKNLIENNNIDAIIGLPANIFFGTGIPTIIMVLKKGRPDEDVLIIDASKGYTKEGKNNKLRARDIKKITDTYIARLETPNYSRRVSRELIRQNDYNLNIPRYVDSSEKPESIDIYATMFGGVPKAEINEMQREFTAFASLESELFTESDTPYVQTKTENVKETIENNKDVKAFKQTYIDAFDGFGDYLHNELIGQMETVLIPREESLIADEIFHRLENIPLVDKYEAYQTLDDKWQIIAADLEMIQTEGISAITQVDPNMVTKKKDGKEVEVQDGYVGHILPFELVQKILLPTDLAEIDDLNRQLTEISGEYEEFIESIPEEDRGDFLNEDNTAFVPKEITKIIKPYSKGKIKPEAGSIEETLIKVDALINREKTLKKAIKDKTTDLHNKTKGVIENLSIDEALPLVSEKWITPITEEISLLPDSIVSELESKINALTKKYSVTMLDIDSEIKQSEASFSSLIDDLEGDEYDMAGLKELQKMLKGE
ncbi:MAG: type I restriction-modification system subunit M [Clostridia bacterium]|nr:type I restriction-modification system subunit M [Clostridia bacterium]